MLSALDMFSIGIGPSSSHTVGPMRAAQMFSHSLVKKGVLSSVARIRVDLYGSLSLTGKGHGTDRAVFAGLEGLDPQTCDTDAVRTDLEKAARSKILLLAGRRRIAFSASDIVFNMHTSLPLHPNGMKFQAFDPTGRVLADSIMYSVGGGFVSTQAQLFEQIQQQRKATGKPPLDDTVLIPLAITDQDGFRRTGQNSQPLHSVNSVDTASEATNTASTSTSTDKNVQASSQKPPSQKLSEKLPYDFATASQLVALCRQTGKTIPEIMLANELALHSADELESGLRRAWDVMVTSVSRGVHSKEKVLPGILHVRRRAPAVYGRLSEPLNCDVLTGSDSQLSEIGQKMPRNQSRSDWVDLFALAVNEENAAGGRIVTAPTNGAAGVIPAVLHYVWAFLGGSWEKTRDFLLTASAIGYLFKRNASISGAEVGCQGEVGTACSMAAAGLCQVMGGTPEQVEDAAEIGIEHNLGLTCDPVAGLVQVPCIERNAVAANTAVNASRMALLGDGNHIVSLDTAIETMKETGRDMMSKYKETSTGGLAVTVTVPKC
jgi:L-serine dehydratase